MTRLVFASCLLLFLSSCGVAGLAFTAASGAKDAFDGYSYAKKKGWFDYVDDIIVPEWREEGVRLDTELMYPLTIKTEYIRCENTPLLLGQLKNLRNLNY